MWIKNIKAESNKLTPAKARIIARCMADGAVYKHKSCYNTKYEVKDTNLLNEFEKDIHKVYGLKMFRWRNPSGKTGELIPFVLLRSKLAYLDLMRYGCYGSRMWRVPKEILMANNLIKIEFLRAFF